MIHQFIYVLVSLLSCNKQVSSFTVTKRRARSQSLLQAITKRVTAVWDGSEFRSLEQYFQSQSNPSHSQPPTLGAEKRRTFHNKNEQTTIGFSDVVAGTKHGTNERIVGILRKDHPNIIQLHSQGQTVPEWVQIDQDSFIYHDSMATIPVGVTDDEAIQTLAASLVGVHCAFHPTILANVGGSLDLVTMNLVGKSAVILGGGDIASFISDALAVLGAKVFQVTNSKITSRPRASSVIIKSPVQRMGDVEVGFSSFVGSFDVIVDCMSDEFDTSVGRSVVLRELEDRHGCHRYISTFSHTQQIVRDEGLLFGPKMADKYIQDCATAILSTTASSSSSSSNFMDQHYVSPPTKFGSITLQKLLDSKILFSQKQQSKNIIHRNWSLKDFWELASWPRDTAGGANFRFGFPVTQDVERIMAEEIDEKPTKKASFSINDDHQRPESDIADEINDYVVTISSLDELEQAIVSTKKTCLMFFSASYCRTCKALTPQYNRLARKLMDQSKMDLTLVKADVSSASGKILSRALDVDAVPTFVMFSRGKLYGDHLSISRIPSKKLDFAIEYLSQGKLWNRKAFESIES